MIHTHNILMQAIISYRLTDITDNNKLFLNVYVSLTAIVQS